MAAEPQGPENLLANGTAEAHLANDGLENSASAPENGPAKLSAAEKGASRKSRES